MKTRIIMISMFFMTFLISGSGCTKEDNINKLPPATQTGENTFGCKINGVVYKCSGYWKPGNIPAMFGVSGNYGDGRFVINALIAKNANHDSHLIEILFNCVENKTGIYREGIKYQGHSAMEGYDSEVEITRFDKDIIAGTFQMKIKYIEKELDSDGNISTTYEYFRTITEGRFDIKRNN